MIKNFKQRFSRFKARLTHINKKEPLSSLALFIVILLDIFVLTVLFHGLADQSRQLTNPAEYIPKECREIFVNNDWTKTNRINRLENIVVKYNRRENYHKKRNHKLHPLCRNLVNQLDKLKNNDQLTLLFNERKRVRNKKLELQNILQEKQGTYEIKLLEKISMVSEKSLYKVKKDIDIKTRALEKAENKIINIDKKINGMPEIIRFWGLTENNSYRQTIIKDLRHVNFWYPVKEYALQLLFLTPVILLLYFWNIKSVKKEKGLQTFISSHLLAIASIPVLFKLIDLAVDILPEHIFRKVLLFLESIKLLALWYYIVIVVSTGIAVALIYFIQKKLFNRDDLKIKHFFQQQCINCGSRLPVKTKACPFCGQSQYETCNHCQKSSFIIGRFCSECGRKK
ncbi:MAG: zinc ribbon domain-containing protein [bacterium]|nr:zinc ribbon domain-containing protein [bacterium]